MKEKTNERYLVRSSQVLMRMSLSKLKPSTCIRSQLSSIHQTFDQTLEELDNLDRKTRRSCTMYDVQRPKVCIEKLYLSRTKGGRTSKRHRDSFCKNSQKALLLKDAKDEESIGSRVGETNSFKESSCTWQRVETRRRH